MYMSKRVHSCTTQTIDLEQFVGYYYLIQL
jgi:hypothetical protein